MQSKQRNMSLPFYPSRNLIRNEASRYGEKMCFKLQLIHCSRSQKQYLLWKINSSYALWFPCSRKRVILPLQTWLKSCWKGNGHEVTGLFISIWRRRVRHSRFTFNTVQKGKSEVRPVTWQNEDGSDILQIHIQLFHRLQKALRIVRNKTSRTVKQ